VAFLYSYLAEQTVQVQGGRFCALIKNIIKKEIKWNNLKVMNKTKKEKKAHKHGQKQGFVHRSENLQNP
jgi:hypothetical protein